MKNANPNVKVQMSNQTQILEGHPGLVSAFR